MTARELRTIRRRLGVSQARLARLIGVRQNTVGRWERDELSISEPVARLIRIVGGEPVESVVSTKRSAKK